mmetsp:Transcript_58068/g.126133  ORF Transcript_58068/g.126133 Transcript_58068/m.126133 type:complete len:90 (+) Transcript_58068:1568-1837(+)
MVATYCAARASAALSPLAWRAFCALCWHRQAAIAHGVFARALQGNASSTEAARFGRAFCETAALGLAACDDGGGARAGSGGDAQPRAKL